MNNLTFKTLIILSLLVFTGCEEEPVKTVEPVLGELTAYSDCLNTKSISNTYNAASNFSCVYYQLENGKLKINHLNAGFNCCTEGITADLTIDGDTIHISEAENNALCNCNCLYNLEIELHNIGFGIYRLVFHEPYADPNQMAQLDFIINTSDSLTGEICVERNMYPWGLL